MTGSILRRRDASGASAALPSHVRLPGCEQFTVEILAAHLETFGFAVTLEPQATATFGALGLFFAERGPRR
jgi:hypothetical protein